MQRLVEGQTVFIASTVVIRYSALFCKYGSISFEKILFIFTLFLAEKGKRAFWLSLCITVTFMQHWIAKGRASTQANANPEGSLESEV